MDVLSCAFNNLISCFFPTLHKLLSVINIQGKSVLKIRT